MIKISKATNKDIEEIAKLMLEEFAKPPFNEKAPTKAVLKSLKFYLKIGMPYIVTADKKIVGVVIFKVEQYWEGKVIIIEDLAVKDEFKKQGICKMLIGEVEAYAKKNKIKAICFSTDKKSSAVKFYQKQGYKIRKNRISMEKKIKSFLYT